MAYVRVLQYSQDAPLADLPAAGRDELEKGLAAPPGSAEGRR